MTGFARAEGMAGESRFRWELRSVNGRGLDVRIRLPGGYEPIEPSARDLIARGLARGNVTANLTLDQDAGAAEVRVNEAALARLLTAVKRLAADPHFDKPRPEGVLALRGVIEVGEATAATEMTAASAGAILSGLQKALAELTSARRQEGERLGVVLAVAVDRIEQLVAAIDALPSRRQDVIQARLAEQVRRLLDTNTAFEPARLHQEAVLLATRADVEEELKRLTSHVAAARALLGESAAVGRKLDFLSQEFNREANTICSKSGDIEMTRLGLELKAVIDQVREQVQNIE